MNLQFGIRNWQGKCPRCMTFTFIIIYCIQLHRFSKACGVRDSRNSQAFSQRRVWVWPVQDQVVWGNICKFVSKCVCKNPNMWIYLAGGNSNIFGIFTPIPGEMIQFDWYFSDGFKPPTRYRYIESSSDVSPVFLGPHWSLDHKQYQHRTQTGFSQKRGKLTCRTWTEATIQNQHKIARAFKSLRFVSLSIVFSPYY